MADARFCKVELILVPLLFSRRTIRCNRAGKKKLEIFAKEPLLYTAISWQPCDIFLNFQLNRYNCRTDMKTDYKHAPTYYTHYL